MDRWRRGGTFGKTYGNKVRCYWEHPWGTDWEPDRNPLRTLGGTCWEQRKKENILPFLQTQNFKRK
jgi:hypothetical protein